VSSVRNDVEEPKRCEYCYSNWQWTMPAFNKHEVLQIGCFRCCSIYNIVDDEYLLVGQRPRHFIFWKDLTRQWDEALREIHASSVKKKASSL